MNNNPFDDLFGNDYSKGYEGIFENFADFLVNKKNTDPALEALIKTFREEIRKDDKEFLKKAIIDHRLEVHEKNNNELLEIHARAALYVNNNKISYESLTKIINPQSKHKEALGLIAFNVGDFNRALQYFEQAEPIHDSTRIPYSITLFENRKKEFSQHEKILNPIIDNVQLANSILGCILCNDSRYLSAEKYFRKAADINPKSEKVRLDLMRILYINDKTPEIYANMNSFFIDTGSRLTSQDIEKEMKERKLKTPKIKINDIYTVVSNILG